MRCVGCALSNVGCSGVVVLGDAIAVIYLRQVVVWLYLRVVEWWVKCAEM